MDAKVVSLLKNIGAQTLSLVLVGAFGVVALGNDNSAEQVKASNSKITAVTTTSQAFESIDFKKAGIEEYDMEVVGDTAPTAKTTTTTKKDDGSFTVAMPDDSTVIYNPDKAAASSCGTRSVYSEYYTVNDIISGKMVTLNAHELLCKMVYSEIGASWDEDAIKAQAVAAYSYLRFNDNAGCIPTVGLKSGYPQKIESCISAIEGQAIYYNNSIINAVYSASSAGVSATSVGTWGVNYPYLQSVVSKYDDEDPNYNIETTYTEAQIKKIIEDKTDIKLSDDVKNWFSIESVYSKVYVDDISIDGHTSANVDGTQRNLTGMVLRTYILGLDALRSNAFTISYKDGVFTFTTSGYGHGVGMSQWGDCLYAKAGYTYDQILKHYYMNVSIAVSSVNSKAVKRGQMSQAEIESEIENSEVVDNVDVNENAAAQTTTAKTTTTTTKTTTKNTSATTKKTTATTTSYATTTTKSAEQEDDAIADEVPQDTTVTTVPEEDLCEMYPQTED